MKIPKHAKRVFKGIIFDVYHWKQKLFDGSFTTFEALKRQDSIVVISATKKNMIILKQKQPGRTWFLSEPSGRMDKAGESPLQTAKRELLEETGYRAGKMQLWKKITPSTKMDYAIYLFIAKNCRKLTHQNLDKGEKIQIQEISFEQWLQLSDDATYIEGVTKLEMMRARLNKKYKDYLKKLIFG